MLDKATNTPAYFAREAGTKKKGFNFNKNGSTKVEELTYISTKIEPGDTNRWRKALYG
jgi:hypothetical protein